MLDCLSVYVTPIPAKAFVSKLASLHFSKEVRSASLEKIQTGLRQLEKARILFKVRRGDYMVEPSFREPIVRHLLVTEGRYNEVYLLAHTIAGTQRSANLRWLSEYQVKTEGTAIREGRHALLTFSQTGVNGKPTNLSSKCQNFETCDAAFARITQGRNLLDFIVKPFDPTWLARLPEQYRERYWSEEIEACFDGFVPLDDEEEKALQREILAKKKFMKRFDAPVLYLQYLLLRGEAEKIDAILKNPHWPESTRDAVAAVRAFMKGDFAKCEKHFSEARRAFRGESTAKRHALPPFFECFHILCGISKRNPEIKHWQSGVFELYADKYDDTVWDFLKKLDTIVVEGSSQHSMEYPEITDPAPSLSTPFAEMLDAAALIWCGNPDHNAATKEMSKLAAEAKKTGFAWLADEAAAVAEALAKKPISNAKAVMPGLIRIPSRWEIVKTAILSLKKPSGATPAEADDPLATQRLTWRLTASGVNFDLEPYEQVRTKTGEWTQGRKVALSRLYADWKRMGFLTDQDRAVCGCLESETYFHRRYPETVYGFRDISLSRLVGHPLVFDAARPERRIELLPGKPEIKIVQDKGNTKITIHPFPPSCDTRRPGYDETSGPDVMLKKETARTYRVVLFDEAQQKVARIVSKSGIVVPKDKQSEITLLLEPLIGDFNIDCNIDAAHAMPQLVESLQTTESVPSDSRIFLRLIPENEFFYVDPVVFPLGESLGGHPPGSGAAALFGEVEGRQVFAQRDFATETKNLDSVFTACPPLSKAKTEGTRYRFEATEQILEFLETLPNLDKENVVVQWPRGEKYRVSSTVSFRNFNLRFSGHTDWFEASGNLQVDGMSLDLKDLLKALDDSPTRFVKINNKEYVALTEEFRRKLDELRSFSHQRGKSVAIHPLAAQAVNRSFADLPDKKSPAAQKVVTDVSWRNAIKRFKAAEKYVPKLPKTFQGDMRDYQRDGFVWLAQLSAWGAGACLADDMGLGKTIQGLALLLLRMNEGPALVVAPTSVCENWDREANRFAPILKIKRISAQIGPASDDYKEERAKTIKNARKGDVVVTNYSLLQIEQEHFAKKKFATIILDEAQAIKNFDAGRTQAAFGLRGDFRVIMTGTPIENHLGEFWSLFQFINPGFLGSRQEFERRFVANAMPAPDSLTDSEKDAIQSSRRHLKTLVRPFLLRRTKGEVLAELPPRTDIRLDVELSKEEALLYETIRTTAIQKISQAKNERAGTQHLKVLAELMRLRRTCCHPALVLPDNTRKKNIPCSKLDLLEDVVREMLDNNHKALVFSQFVDYLKLIAERLDSMGVSYQYLDGSMTQAKRQKSIDAFQSGESDLFLISLKAGGSGLNLTAADYVIHMDPWWNPAVENQASDRAHRIGQQRPVTVYRMITKGTIEEKIIELHQRKESLAREILEGTDKPTKFSLDQLLEILWK